jgi:hypothetical protein
MYCKKNNCQLILSSLDFERLSRLSIAENPRFSAQNILFLIAVSLQSPGWISVNEVPEHSGFKRDIRINTNPLRFAVDSKLCHARKVLGADGREILQVRQVLGAFQSVPVESTEGQNMMTIFLSLNRFMFEHPFCSPLVCLLLSSVYVRHMRDFKLILRLIASSSHSSSIQLMSNDLGYCYCLKLEQNDNGLSLLPI